MIRKKIKIENKLGLHARPATMLVKIATKYRSDCRIVKDDMDINGKSIMGVMMLAAECGSELELIADGIDEEYLMNELVELFTNKFNEE
ncbi:MAG: HPr family phosphocarrier protein [Candidatus Cloacimonadales bacterium]